MKIPTKYTVVLVGLVVIWLALGITTRLLVSTHAVDPLPLPADETAPIIPHEVELSLSAAQDYLQENLVEENGHVKLYQELGIATIDNPHATNSEAMSYYLLWTVQEGHKVSFDTALDYIEEYMQHDSGYLMWRVEENGSIVDDGANIASDADLRAIWALYLAEEKWGDEQYTLLIDEIAKGLETVAVTRDNHLAPYGGIAGDPWIANEIWLSYSDFRAFAVLGERRAEPWTKVYSNTKSAVIDAQIANGLFNQMLTPARRYGTLDNGYSINSLWIMVRAAESGDEELMQVANASLAFYKNKYEEQGEIAQRYSSSGDPLSSGDTPWTYALVGRAAVHLGDQAFAAQMIEEIRSFQRDEGPLRGAIIEGSPTTERVGQFTMQESILTMQDYESLMVNNAVPTSSFDE